MPSFEIRNLPMNIWQLSSLAGGEAGGHNHTPYTYDWFMLIFAIRAT